VPPCDKSDLDWHLVRRSVKRLPCNLLGNSSEFIDYSAGTHTSDPIFGLALSLAHTGLRRFCRNRFMRENPYPQLSFTRKKVHRRHAARFDLPAPYPARFFRLKAIVPKGNCITARGLASDSAPLAFSVLYPFGH